MTAAQERWLALKQEWASNPRVRLGATIIALIVAWYGLMAFADAGTRAARDYDQAAQRLGKMRALVGEKQWSARATAARRLREALEAEIPSLQTAGLAQANFQTLLGRWLGNDNGWRLQMGAATAVAESPSIWSVTATISGNVEASEVLALVRQIESQRQLVIVDDLRVSAQQGNSASLRLTAYYRITESSEASP